MRRGLLIAATVGLVLALAGCAAATEAAPSSSPTSSASADSASVMVEDAWVKAAGTGEMTALFATLHNHSDADITLVSAGSPVSDELQLHETTADASGSMTMSEVDGGLVIPAGGALGLEPGGDHVMFMGLQADLDPGDSVEVTLTFADGSALDVTAVVKDYSGADEDYTSTPSGSTP